MNELIERRTETWNQYIEGAITFVEMVYWMYANITEDEMKEYNEYRRVCSERL